MADREKTSQLYNKHKRKGKHYKPALESLSRVQSEKVRKERERLLEAEEAEQEIKEYTK